MRVVFDGDAAQYHPGTGLELKPGENEVADDKGEQLLSAGLVRKPEGKRARKEG